MAMRAFRPEHSVSGKSIPAHQPPAASKRDIFSEPIQPRWIPPEMLHAPVLDHSAPKGRLKLNYALLINPFYPKDPNASFGKHVLTPTLALTSFAATTPANWQVRYWDENLLHGLPPGMRADEPGGDTIPEVVGISVHLTFAARAFELARWYRQRGAKVVLGGLHVLSCPEECAPHADALAMGDGVQLWPQILADVENGALAAELVGNMDPYRDGWGNAGLQRRAKIYQATYENEYATDPAPKRQLLARDSFLTTTSLIATRGCHNRCGFCYLATEGLRMPYRMRDVQQIVDEFAADDQPYAVFVDNNLGSKREYLRALCRGLRPLNKIWSAAVSIDVTDDPSIVREMALGGCTGVFVGFESLTDQNLSDARKKTPKTAEYARRVRLLHDYGIQVNGSFVLGFDHDDKDVFVRTAEWVEENRLECATFHILTPYPATPLFRQMEAEGRLLHKDWSKYDTSHCVFHPKQMSAEELEHGYAWIYQRLFSHASIWARRPEDWRAVPPYMAMSYLYKKSNRLWHQLIKRDMVKTVWRPLVEVTRWRHVAYRRELERMGSLDSPRRHGDTEKGESKGESNGKSNVGEGRPKMSGQVVSAGV